MHAVSEWWTRQHGVVRWTGGIVATVALYGVAYLVVASIFDLDPARSDMAIRWILALASVPLFAVGVLVQRRRLGGKGQLRLYRQAYRTGRIPEGANVERWGPVVRKQARFFREGGRLQRVVAIVMMGLLLVIAIVGLVLSAGDIDTGVAVAVVVALAVFALLYWGVDRLWRMRRRQFDRLEKALETERT